MKKIQIIGCLMLLVLSVHSALSYDFQDVDEQNPHRAAIDYLSDEGIIEGQGGDVRFDPTGLLNRAEWVVILNRSAGEEPGDDEYGFCFPDVTDEWFAPATCFAHQQGWIHGYSAGPEAGMFRAGNTLTVGEILVTLQRQRSWPVTEGDQWYAGALTYAQIANLVDASWTFDHRLTRAEAVEVLFRVIAVEHFGVQRYDPLLAEVLVPAQPSAPTVPSDPSVAARVSLRPFPDMPSNATLGQGSLYVPVLRFTLEADQEVTLDQLSVRRISVGSNADLKKGRLLINGKVVKEGVFTSNSTVLWRDLKHVLHPGQVFLVEMSVDFVENAMPSLVYQFQVEPVQIVFSQPNVVIDGAKIVGKDFRIASLPADTVTIKNPSSKLSIPFIETEGAMIGKFTIKAGKHDVLIKRIRLEDAGFLNNKDFSNFRLTAGSQEISLLDDIDRSTLDFSINDYSIEADHERSFTVLADILSPRIDSFVRLYLEDTSDVHAYDLQFGFGTRVVNQFGRDIAWCLGSNSITCPKPGLRKHCSREDVENKVKDCVP